ncbi:hypothetical protein C8R41DRAFT_563544 [Lentinula lateritia]|uniref:Secreted protein n=1 Tax=Lentinula lateritia TaxID=40482 RepID=A0ABQ8V872_9AGAR|nr:hypothetical protein C8R41DRAFT_563544 [Lentinula lateritia]
MITSDLFFPIILALFLLDPPTSLKPSGVFPPGLNLSSLTKSIPSKQFVSLPFIHSCCYYEPFRYLFKLVVIGPARWLPAVGV